MDKYNKIFYGSGPVSFNDIIKDKYNNVHKKLYQNALTLFLNDKIVDNGVEKEGDYTVVTYEDLKPTTTYEPTDVENHVTDERDKVIAYKESNYVNSYNGLISFKELYEKGDIIIREIENSEYYLPSEILIMGYYTYTDDNGTPLKDDDDMELTVKIFERYSLEDYWSNYHTMQKTYTPQQINHNEELKDSKIIRYDYLNGRALLYSRLADKKYWVDLNHIYDRTFDSDYTLSNTFSNLLQNNY